MTWTNQAKHSSAWSDVTKHSSSYSNKQKTTSVDAILLEQGGYMLQENSSKLLIEQQGNTSWSNVTKH